MRNSSLNFSLLHRTCSLVVLLCFLHIFVTVIYYVKNSDSRQTFVQNQQTPQIHRKLTEQRVSTEEPTPPSVSNVTETEKKLETCPDNPPRLGKNIGNLSKKLNVNHLRPLVLSYNAVFIITLMLKMIVTPNVNFCFKYCKILTLLVLYSIIKVIGDFLSGTLCLK